jgi:F0F1-type ATP synthase membrane subunit b/b'
MDEGATLSHLLEVERKAEEIVANAQAKASQSVRENEHNCRVNYEKTYASQYAALEDSYKKEINALDIAYDAKLSEYRDSLKDMPQNRAVFNTLAAQLLFQEG